MRKALLVCLLFFGVVAAVGAEEQKTLRRVAIEWREGPSQGQITVSDGNLVRAAVARGQGTTAAGARFSSRGAGAFRLELEIQGTEATYGPGSTRVTVNTARNPFSFFLRDVSREYPICILEYGIAVTEAADPRSYAGIEAAIRARGQQSKLEQVESEPEESFENAAASTRSLLCPTWLGMGRDMRIFSVGERLDAIHPRYHGEGVALPETDNKSCGYAFLMGRGWGPKDDIKRRLEDGTLPILLGTLADGGITYQLTAFVGPESKPLTRENLRGTHSLVADGHGVGHMFTAEQKAQYEALLPAEIDRAEETVLYLRMTAVNTSKAPRYAFFRTVVPTAARQYDFDPMAGLASYKSGRVFAVSKLNGKPLSHQEVSIRLNPGETAQLETFLPHRPLARERALQLREGNFAALHAACRSFWQEKLSTAARIRLPEPRISDMIQAGLLHLDLITYGLEPEGTLAPTIGVYSPIGSESSPIIQFMDTMGWHQTAQRALNYFLDKQHEDGFIQNFGGYMLETGAALWSLGEHFRYTRDEGWVRQIAPKLTKSCEYLQRWRQRNLREDLRTKGYGMLEGKVADPEDPYRSFMLNGYAYLGLSRVAEMLAPFDQPSALKWRKEAEDFKQDIRTAFFEVMARSPVIPLQSGFWIPTVPPWVEYRGPLLLHADGGKWFTHGAMSTRDSLLGPLYLILQEVIDPTEPAATVLVNFHNDLMTERNVAFSQPYYSRHPMAHLRRGEVKPFLKAYYNTVASLADRETFTFWEHFFGASPHKTHEEAWFLMDTRWMLCLERGPGLDLLAGIPRSYLEHGKQIDIGNLATYFGRVSLRVSSRVDEDRIEAVVECSSERKPKFVEVRLPHPLGRKARWVKGGTYDPATERVRIEPFAGRAELILGFDQP